MKINRVWAVYASPCGSTKKVVLDLADTVSRELGLILQSIDFTLLSERSKEHTFLDTDIVIFGMPVYAGRIPNKLLSYVKEGFQGNGALAVPVSVFGNRNFDDALFELKTELEQNHFQVIAAAAIAAQHVFSDKIGQGRPDKTDWDQIHNFSKDLISRLELVQKEGKIISPAVPYKNQPIAYYIPKGMDGEPVSFLKAKPKTDAEKCTHCNQCVNVCPMAAINPKDPTEITGTCIKCQACIQNCSEQAKYFDDPAFLSHVRMLEKTADQRVDPQFY